MTEKYRVSFKQGYPKHLRAKVLLLLLQYKINKWISKFKKVPYANNKRDL